MENGHQSQHQGYGQSPDVGSQEISLVPLHWKQTEAAEICRQSDSGSQSGKEEKEENATSSRGIRRPLEDDES